MSCKSYSESGLALEMSVPAEHVRTYFKENLDFVSVCYMPWTGMTHLVSVSRNKSSMKNTQTWNHLHAQPILLPLHASALYLTREEVDMFAREAS